MGGFREEEACCKAYLESNDQTLRSVVRYDFELLWGA